MKDDSLNKEFFSELKELMAKHKVWMLAGGHEDYPIVYNGKDSCYINSNGTRRD